MASKQSEKPYLRVVASSDVPPSDPEPLVSLNAERAARFLEHLKYNPFIAIIVDEDEDLVRIFKQRITREELEAIRTWLDLIEAEISE